MAHAVRGAGGISTFGSIYVHDGSTAQSVNTGAAQKITGFNTAAGANGASNNMTPDKANNQITFTYAGLYKVAFQCAFQSGSNVTWQMHAHDAGGELSALGTHRKTPTTDVGSCSFVGQYQAAAGAVLSVYVEHDAGGNVDFTPIDMQLVIERISES